MSRQSDREWGRNTLRLIAASLIIVAVLFSVIYVRHKLTGYYFSNGESYDSIRLGRGVQGDPLLANDDLQERPYYPSLMHYLLAASFSLFGEINAIYLVPILLGLGSALSFRKLLITLEFPERNAWLAMILITSAPAFLMTFTSLSKGSICVFLSMFALAAYFNKSYWDCPWKISGKIVFSLAIFALVLLSISSLLGLAITLFAILAISLLSNRSLASLGFALAVPLMILIPLSIFTPFVWRLSIETIFRLPSAQNAFSVFGVDAGFDLFLLLLFITGLTIMWSYMKRFRIYNLFALAFVVASFFSPLLSVYASFLIAVYCVFAIKHLYFRKWELEVVKGGTVLLLICALVFSMLSEASNLTNSEPGRKSAPVIEALKSLPQGTVFTEPSFGFLVQEETGKKVLLDEKSHLYYNFFALREAYSSIAGSSRITEAEPTLKSQGIRYLLLTPRMKDVLWENNEEKLPFLLRNSERFELVAENGEFELWEYLPEATATASPNY